MQTHELWGFLPHSADNWSIDYTFNQINCLDAALRE